MSHAATTFVSVEAEDAIRTGNATLVDDTNASNDKAIQFNAPSAPGTFVIRDATNTGPTGILTSCAGNRDITTAGTVIQNCIINGDIGIRADNVTIKNSRITGTIMVGRSTNGGSDKDVKNPIVEDTELIGNGNEDGIKAVSDFDGIYRRNNMHGWQNCMKMWTSTRAQILDSWCHDEQSNTGSPHFDGIEVYGAEGGMIIRGNSVYQTQSSGATAPLNITTEGSDINGTMLIENNLMRSANPGYVILVAARQSGELITIVANNNRLWRAPGGTYIDFWGSSQGKIRGSGTGNVDHLTGAAVSVPAAKN